MFNNAISFYLQWALGKVIEHWYIVPWRFLGSSPTSTHCHACFKSWVSLSFWPRRLHGLAMVFYQLLDSDLLFCPIHRILIIWEEIIPDLVLSCIVTEYRHIENLLGKMWKYLILVSYVLHDILTKRALLIRCDKEVWIRMVVEMIRPPMVWYQRSHCYVTMALRLVTATCPRLLNTLVCHCWK